MNSQYESVLMKHIWKQAPNYFPGIVSDRITVQLREKQKRPSAMLYKFEIMDGAQDHSIVVKVPMRNLPNIDTEDTTYKKPSLFQKADAQDMHWLQYTALTSMYEYFAQLKNERLGAIHVLDYLPEYQAILIVEARDPSLQE